LPLFTAMYSSITLYKRKIFRQSACITSFRASFYTTASVKKKT
jgi:hypothetical protein